MKKPIACLYLIGFIFCLGCAIDHAMSQALEPHKDKPPHEFTPPVTIDAPYAVGEIVRHKASGHRGQILDMQWITDYTKRPSVERVISFRVRFWSTPPQAPVFETVPMQEFELEPDKK